MSTGREAQGDELIRVPSASVSPAPASASESALAIDCRQRFDLAFYCATPAFQLTQFYLNGELNNCREIWGQMVQCFRAKMMPTEKAEAFLRNSPLDPTRPRHTATVWEVKETTGWS